MFFCRDLRIGSILVRCFPEGSLRCFQGLIRKVPPQSILSVLFALSGYYLNLAPLRGIRNIIMKSGTNIF